MTQNVGMRDSVGSLRGKFCLISVPSGGEDSQRWQSDDPKDWSKVLFEKHMHLLLEENVIMSDGMGLFLERWAESVDSIVAGDQVSPTPSTFTNNQGIQAPISGLLFPKIATGAKVLLPSPQQGWKFQFRFLRHAASAPGRTATELGLKVARLDTSSELLSRVVEGDPNAAGHLPFTFLTDEDTLGLWEIEVVVA